MNPIDRATDLVNKAEAQGITLRLIGHAAFKVHCPNNSNLFNDLKREITDIDFVSYSKYKDRLMSFLEHEGLQTDRRMKMLMTVLGRYKLKDSETGLNVDVFFDRLSMNHTIEFAKRLELDSPSVTVSDLFLEKMQIVKINEKDVKDSIVLILEHEMGNDETDKINGKYVSDILSDDWGFYHTVTTNLTDIRDSYLKMYRSIQSPQVVVSRINDILHRIDGEPKSFRWKLRAKVGTAQKWYNEVEDS